MYNDTYSGIIIIIDYKNVTPTHIAKVGLSGFKMAVSLLVDVYASRIKRIHFINTSPVIESSILLLKSLLNEKIGSRVSSMKIKFIRVRKNTSCETCTISHFKQT